MKTRKTSQGFLRAVQQGQAFPSSQPRSPDWSRDHDLAVVNRFFFFFGLKSLTFASTSIIMDTNLGNVFILISKTSSPNRSSLKLVLQAAFNGNSRKVASLFHATWEEHISFEIGARLKLKWRQCLWLAFLPFIRGATLLRIKLSTRGPMTSLCVHAPFPVVMSVQNFAYFPIWGCLNGCPRGSLVPGNEPRPSPEGRVVRMDDI